VEGSTQATIALLLALPVMFWTINRWGPIKGSVYAILGGMMFLPEHAQIKLPLLPEFTKHRIIMLGLLIGIATGKLRLRGRAEWWIWPMMVLAFLSGVFVWQTNLEPLVYGAKVCDALNFKDGMYVSLSTLMGPALAVYLGMRLYRDERDLAIWLEALTKAGLVYSAFILVELKFSPQWHTWVYGYAGHDQFLQTMRFGGYRPQVFTAHGLACSLLMLGFAMPPVVLARYGEKVWKKASKGMAWWLILIVIACKSTGVWLYGIIGFPMARWGSAKGMLRIALAIAILVCAYPGLRITDKFPTQAILDYAAMIQEDRMFSLKFRFDNETVLIEHAIKKPWFGWGYSYGRNMLYDDTGYVTSVTDGGWIIAFGGAGVLGLVLDLGLPVFAILTIWWRIGKIRDVKQRNYVGVLTLYLAFMLMDVIPNAAFNLLQFYMAGMLCGITQTLVKRKRAAPRKDKLDDPAPPPPPRVEIDDVEPRPEPITV
jgi:hypothetical protein